MTRYPHALRCHAAWEAVEPPSRASRYGPLNMCCSGSTSGSPCGTGHSRTLSPSLYTATFRAWRRIM
ncbi:hypothetical protein AB0941_36810 [Streptomyces sp. NPDC013433]|uniref:hypothetical protein n=1 Tax=Streptomyces sp. NPDC013433 TaxID=3155604 RepID=UPI0034535C05